MPVERFAQLLEQVTNESREFLRVTKVSEDEAFQAMLAQVLEAFTFKLGETGLKCFTLKHAFGIFHNRFTLTRQLNAITLHAPEYRSNTGINQ